MLTKVPTASHPPACLYLGLCFYKILSLGGSKFSPSDSSQVLGDRRDAGDVSRGRPKPGFPVLNEEWQSHHLLDVRRGLQWYGGTAYLGLGRWVREYSSESGQACVGLYTGWHLLE